MVSYSLNNPLRSPVKYTGQDSENRKYFKVHRDYFIFLMSLAPLTYARVCSNVISFVTLQNWVWKEEKGWVTVNLHLMLDCQHTWPSHFSHHPEPPHTPAKESLTLCCILCSKISKHLTLFTIWLFTVDREHFAHHCNSAASGMRGSISGREQGLHEGSKNKVLNVMFLTRLGGNSRQR